MMPSPHFVERVLLRNYKSIAACDVALGPLTFLVGPNGSGKSNFVDSLRFVAEALTNSLDHALRERGGIQEVRRRSGGHPTHFGIGLRFRLPEVRGRFAFDIAAKPNGGYVVQREECLVEPLRFDGPRGGYEVREGTVRRFDAGSPPAAAGDRLYLVNASGLPPFRAVYDALSRMGFYSLNPNAIRELQPPDPGELLKRDGSNLASVLARLESDHPATKSRIEEYLGRVVPGTLNVERKALGPRETIEFRQEISGAKHPWRFLAANMSDGTVRALAILVALFQGRNGNGQGVRLVAIEEPETALHPAAVGILTDSLREASVATQVLVTSHSTDLLDDEAIPDEALLAVVSEGNETKIGPLDPAGRSALRDHLYTAGELLRMDQLRPDPAATSPRQLDLFSSPGDA